MRHVAWVCSVGDFSHSGSPVDSHCNISDLSCLSFHVAEVGMILCLSYYNTLFVLCCNFVPLTILHIAAKIFLPIFLLQLIPLLCKIHSPSLASLDLCCWFILKAFHNLLHHTHHFIFKTEGEHQPPVSPQAQPSPSTCWRSRQTLGFFSIVFLYLPLNSKRGMST